MARELTQILIQDMSCDPINATAQSFMGITQRAKYWDDKAAAVGNGTPLARAIQTAACSILRRPPADVFHFDLQMIESVGQNLETASIDVRQDFSEFVATISDHYCDVIKFLPALGNVEITQKAKEITSVMRNVAHDVETWSNGIAQIAGSVAKLPFPEPVKKFLNQVGTTSTDIATISTQIGNTLDSLWQRTEQVVVQADALNHQAAQLRTNLAAANPADKPRIQAELKAVESQLKRESNSLANKLEGVRAGFQAASVIAGLFGESKLANDIIAVGEASVTIVASVATLIAGSAAGGPAMPIIAIVGAIGMLASRIFGGGTEKREDMILKSINQLSKHIDQRFDRIEAMIQKSVEYLAEHIDKRLMALGNHLDQRFDRVEETLKYMYIEMLTQFKKMHTQHADDFVALQINIQGIRQAIDYLHTDLSQGMQALYTQRYRDKKDRALRPMARDQITAGQHYACYQSITTCAKTDAKSGVLSGSDNANNVVDRVSAEGVNSNINKIRSRAMQLTSGTPHNIPDTGRLVNPAIWADGVRTLMAYFAMTPKLYEIITPQNVILNDLRAIKEEGKRVNHFLNSVQKNYYLFGQLVENYRTALRGVLERVFELSVVADPNNLLRSPSSSPDAALNRVIAIGEMPTFIGQEIYPSTGKPNFTRLSTIHHHNQEPYDFTANFQPVILREIAHGLDRTHPSFPNGWHHKTFHEGMKNGELRHYDKECCLADKMTNIRSATFDRLNANYATACGEASSLRSATSVYETFNDNSHDASLKNNPSYRNKRIAAVLTHHAVAECQRVNNTSNLPHGELLAKYFSIKDKNALNAQLKADHLLGTRLNDLQSAFKELCIFIGFAFPKAFASDPHLRVLLDRLWNKENIDNCIKPRTTHNEFVAITLQRFLEAGHELDCFKQYLIEMVADASQNKEHYHHPLVEKVLQELDAFEVTLRLATQILVQPNHNKKCVHPFGGYTEIVPDGNCFFRAVAHQLENPKVDHINLREMAIHYMENHMVDFLEAFGGSKTDFDEYIKLMRKDGSWADGLIIAALALQQNVRLIILDDEDLYTQAQQRQFGFIDENEKAQKIIHLLRVNNNHYHAFHPEMKILEKRPEYQARITNGLLKEASDTLKDLSKTIQSVEGDIKLLETLVAQKPSNVEAETPATNVMENSSSYRPVFVGQGRTTPVQRDVQADALEVVNPSSVTPITM